MNVLPPIGINRIMAVAPAPAGPSRAGRRMPVLPGVIRALFDRSFYLRTYPDVAAAGIDALEHFLERGMHEDRTPHPLFDPGFYAAQMPVEAASEPAFLHYLQDGAFNRLDPHPLFDTAHYITQSEDQTLFGQLPLLHFLASGTRAQLSPNPLFDAAYYRRVNRIETAHPRHPLLHYIETGWREGCRTHPLFDPAYYLALRPDVALAGHDPLAHFLRHGCHETASTHEMFDAVHYRQIHLDQPEECAAIDRVGAIIHYATHARLPRRSPHPLFQPEFYATSQGRALDDGVGRDPFLHFLEHGLLPERRVSSSQDPHPLFDGTFYLRRYSDVASHGDVPLLHFIRHGAHERRDPNEFFDAMGYTQLHPEAEACRYGALSHYLENDVGMIAPSVRFDPVYYADGLDPAERSGPDLRSRLDPLTHYLTSGRQDGRTPLPQPMNRLAWRGIRSPGHEAGARPLLLISPDASGQPISLCALRAVQRLAADPGLACHVALLRGGALEPEFNAVVPTLLLQKRQDAVELLYSFQREAPEGIVIVNTATMPDVAALAGRLGLRTLAWLHEMPVSIDSLLGGAATMQALADNAARIITVSHHARTALCQRYGLAAEQLVVLGNGVDQQAGGVDQQAGGVDQQAGGVDQQAGGVDQQAVGVDQQTSRDAAASDTAALRHELGMPPDALLVLGGGPIDFRRGTDLFIKVAQQVVLGHVPANIPGANIPGANIREAHFIWIGEEVDRLFSGLCQHDIQKLGLADRVRFLSDPVLMQRLLAQADIFLMTARAEAFDGDGQQAQCNGLAVVAFAGCVNAADLPGEDIALTVPYLDVEAMARAVMKLGNRPVGQRQAGAMPAPSWDHWCEGLRLILEQDFGLPPIVPVQI